MKIKNIFKWTIIAFWGGSLVLLSSCEKDDPKDNGPSRQEIIDELIDGNHNDLVRLKLHGSVKKMIETSHYYAEWDEVTQKIIEGDINECITTEFNANGYITKITNESMWLDELAPQEEITYNYDSKNRITEYLVISYYYSYYYPDNYGTTSMEYYKSVVTYDDIANTATIIDSYKYPGDSDYTEETKVVCSLNKYGKIDGSNYKIYKPKNNAKQQVFNDKPTAEYRTEYDSKGNPILFYYWREYCYYDYYEQFEQCYKYVEDCVKTTYQYY